MFDKSCNHGTLLHITRKQFGSLIWEKDIMDLLLFIDTNIYLDFYRMRNEGRKGFLAHLESIENKIVITDQVEMEFQKNRQQVIIETIQLLKPPSKIARPGLLSDDRTYGALAKDIDRAKERVEKLRKRMEGIIKDPSRNDPVFKFVQRICRKRNALRLMRGTDQARVIRELAQKRFALGYPPRKSKDTSMGDSVNWEWIVDVCVRERPNRMLIVSRDNDYGITLENSSYLNDWLKQEFRERTSNRIAVELYTKLGDVLKECKVPVSSIEEKSEESLFMSSGDYYEPVEGECIRCGGAALFDAICNKCGEYVLGDEDGESYSINEDGKLTQLNEPSDYYGIVTCDCGSDDLEIHWHSLCSWCNHMASKDD